MATPKPLRVVPINAGGEGLRLAENTVAVGMARQGIQALHEWKGLAQKHFLFPSLSKEGHVGARTAGRWWDPYLCW